MAYTTPDRVAVLLRRPLSSGDAAYVNEILPTVDALVNQALAASGVDAASVDPALLQYVAGDIIKTALINSEGIESESDTAGPYSHSQKLANPLSQLFLTAAHRKMLGLSRGKSGARMAWGAI